MTKVYLISGLGADKRFFKKLVLPHGFEIVLTEVLIPMPAESIDSYAQRMIERYEIDVASIVLGDSLGGMIAVEIAKRIRLKNVILTSTIKTSAEAPTYFKLLRKLPVYQITPGKLINKLAEWAEPVLRKLKANDAQVLRSMLENSSPEFLKWGAQAALNWRNDIIPPNLFHFIGDKDLVFPYKNVKDPTAIIQGGTHIMVFDKANEINRLLADILNK